MVYMTVVLGSLTQLISRSDHLDRGMVGCVFRKFAGSTYFLGEQACGSQPQRSGRRGLWLATTCPNAGYFCPHGGVFRCLSVVERVISMTVVLGSHTQLLSRSNHRIGLRSSWVSYWSKSENSQTKLMF